MTLLAAALIGLLSCTTAQTAGGGTSRMVDVNGQQVPAEKVARGMLEEGNAAARTHDDAKAKRLFEDIRKDYADTTSYGGASVGLARLLLEAGDAKGAQAVVEKLLLDDPTSPAADDARYVLAMSQLQQGDSKSAAPTLKSLVDKLPDDEKADGYARLGHQLYEQGQGTEAARYLSRAIEAGAADKANLEKELFATVDGLVPFNDVRLLLETEAKPNTLLDELLTMKLARVHLHLRDYASSNDMTARYLQRYPTGRFAKQAQGLKEQLAARMVVDNKVVGVILPLSGDYAAYGKRALTAVKIGFGVAVKADAPPPEPQLDPATGEPVQPPPDAPAPDKKKKNLEETFTTPAGLKVIVRDSAGDATKVTSIVRDLVQKEHAIAILGDILLDTSLPAALAAEDEGVPLLSLSRRDGVAEAGPWSFRLALTAKKQAKALVELAVDGIGMKRFAIMYPKHAFGVELMNELWDELEKRQAEVTAVESYAHDQTTFTAEAKSLVGRGMAGSAEVAECRQDAAKIDNDYRRRKAMEGCNDLAKPIVDFEALFIPDSYKTVSYVIPALVAEDVLVTKDRRTVEAYRKTTQNTSVRPVQLLGVSMWNDAELGKRLGRQIDGAIFVDGFDAQDGTPRVQKFVQSFASVHASRPQLVEAQAHDGAALLGALLSGDAPAKTRQALRDALANVKDFPGVTGLIKFDDQGDSATQLRFFQVDGDQIESRDPAALAKAGESG
jgi:ABC-type branched-subunit amino acid transport system substrate-binding protein